MQNYLYHFHLPRYQELPDVGIYLEQSTQYINSYLKPLGCDEITPSMISNYVKKGYINGPVKKQYYADQIAYLFFIAIVKQALSMENIRTLFEMQKKTHDTQIAYDYFCQELEEMLCAIFAGKKIEQSFGIKNNLEENMLKSTIAAVSHIIYLRHCFSSLDTEIEEN